MRTSRSSQHPVDFHVSVFHLAIAARWTFSVSNATSSLYALGFVARRVAVGYELSRTGLWRLVCAVRSSARRVRLYPHTIPPWGRTVLQYLRRESCQARESVPEPGLERCTLTTRVLDPPLRPHSMISQPIATQPSMNCQPSKP